MSPVLSDLIALQEKHKGAADWERLMLKMAVAMYELVEDPWGEAESHALFTAEEYFVLPGRWELPGGRLHPKHWDPDECRGFKYGAGEK